ncbi:MAG: hypothetical protein NUV68_02895 [Caldiserica bacterium]|nr:hypothetical protein [Caldisericota bacterium]MDH7562510.1 hypothetical protein [Caldisericota bacterium]
MAKIIISGLLFALLFIFFPSGVLASNEELASEHFRFLFDDPSLKEKVASLSSQREAFIDFFKGKFPGAKDPGLIECYIFNSWKEAFEKASGLPEGSAYNVYSGGEFQRSEEVALAVKNSLGESASFLQSGLVKLLWDEFRGFGPHTSVLLLLKEHQFYTPYDMMYRPYSLYSTCTFSSFLAFLNETYGREKLLSLLSSVKDYMLTKGQSFLILQTFQGIYGKSIDQLTKEWKDFLLSLPSPPYDSKTYAEAAEFINKAGAEFYLWIDFPNFQEILENYGVLNFYFDNFDMEKTRGKLAQTREMVAQSEKAWKSVRNPVTYFIWGGVALGAILFSVSLYLIIMAQINKRKALAFRKKREKEEKNFEDFLEGKSKD